MTMKPSVCWTLLSSLDRVWVGKNPCEIDFQLFLPHGTSTTSVADAEAVDDEENFAAAAAAASNIICAEAFVTLISSSNPNKGGVVVMEQAVLFPYIVKLDYYSDKDDDDDEKTPSKNKKEKKRIPILYFDFHKTVDPEESERHGFLLGSSIFTNFTRRTSDHHHIVDIKAKFYVGSLPDNIDAFTFSLRFGISGKFEFQQHESMLEYDSCPGWCTFRIQSCIMEIVKLKLCIQTLTKSYSAAAAVVCDAAAGDQGKGGGGGGEQANKLDPEMIEWYSKHGGENTSIDVMIHLKDAKGLIVYDHPDFYLETKLVYEDGNPVMEMCRTGHGNTGNGNSKSSLVTSIGDNSSSNDHVNNKVLQQEPPREIPPKELVLYRPMRPEPVLYNGTGSVHFAFRIEDVSANHKPHIGFKLMVSCRSSSIQNSATSTPMPLCCADGLMEETIVVKSRPTSSKSASGVIQQDKSSTSVGGRTTILQKVLGGIPILEQVSGRFQKLVMKKRTTTPTDSWSDDDKVKKEVQQQVKKEQETNHSDLHAAPAPPAPLPPKNTQKKKDTVPQVDNATQRVLFDMHCIHSFFCGTGDVCLACGETLKTGECLSPCGHKLDCRLFLTLSPLLIDRLTDFRSHVSCALDENIE